MEVISVIIPVFNVEPYLTKCLDSVVAQTYPDLEILLVNDGSTDNCKEICNEYVKRDDRIVLLNKGNGGVSSAKNIGLNNITGQYVGFVDSDDWIEPDMYEMLLSALKDANVSISVASYYKARDTVSTPMINRKHIPNGVINTENMLLYPLKRDYYMGFCGYMCNKLFLAEVFHDNSLRFNEKIRYGEDVLLYSELVLRGKCRGVYTDKPLYYYFQRDTAASKSKSIGFRTDILDAYKQVERLLNNNGYSSKSYWARGFYCYHASVIAEIAIENNDIENLRIMQAEIKRHIDDYIMTNIEFPEKHERMYRLLDYR